MVAHNTSQRAEVNGNMIPPASGTDMIKRATDVIVGLGMLLFAAPVIAIAYTAVRLTSAGPGFYSQVRVGQGGRHYRILKIRSMTHNCEAASGAKWSTGNDYRVTRIGRILRKLHIDELPQLINVLKGDMSLVGPRPERPEFVGPLSVAIPGYADRHAIRPGVTGLAQIQLPPDSDIESVRSKLVLDLVYIQCRSGWLDLRLMFGTVVYLVGFSYPIVRKLMRLPNPLSDPQANSRHPSPPSPSPVPLRLSIEGHDKQPDRSAVQTEILSLGSTS